MEIASAACSMEASGNFTYSNVSKEVMWYGGRALDDSLMTSGREIAHVIGISHRRSAARKARK